MRILAVSDVESEYYYDYYTPGKLAEFDLILSCGDLRREYLEFLATLASCPLLYVPGNHDEAFVSAPPEGCICIDDRLHVYRGIRFLGLGGSHRYREGPYMYTERQMERRVRRLSPAIRRHKGFDVLLTHAPARHCNDFDTPAHQGFACFNTLLERYEPALFVHGHIHQEYAFGLPQRTLRGNTTVINACGHCIIEL